MFWISRGLKKKSIFQTKNWKFEDPKVWKFGILRVCARFSQAIHTFSHDILKTEKFFLLRWKTWQGLNIDFPKMEWSACRKFPARVGRRGCPRDGPQLDHEWSRRWESRPGHIPESTAAASSSCLYERIKTITKRQGCVHLRSAATIHRSLHVCIWTIII